MNGITNYYRLLRAATRTCWLAFPHTRTLSPDWNESVLFHAVITCAQNLREPHLPTFTKEVRVLWLWMERNCKHNRLNAQTQTSDKRIVLQFRGVCFGANSLSDHNFACHKMSRNSSNLPRPKLWIKSVARKFLERKSVGVCDLNSSVSGRVSWPVCLVTSLRVP
jgi:hypothetical protein